MEIKTIGIDLAKNVFQVHAVDSRGKVVLRKQFRRDRVTTFFANLSPCLVGMEACGSAHHWARKLESLGHTVKLMAPQFVMASQPVRRALNGSQHGLANQFYPAGNRQRLQQR